MTTQNQLGAADQTEVYELYSQIETLVDKIVYNGFVQVDAFTHNDRDFVELCWRGARNNPNFNIQGDSEIIWDAGMDIQVKQMEKALLQILGHSYTIENADASVDDEMRMVFARDIEEVQVVDESWVPVATAAKAVGKTVQTLNAQARKGNLKIRQNPENGRRQVDLVEVIAKYSK